MKQQKQPTISEAALRHVIAGRTDLSEVQRALAIGQKKAAG